MGRPRGSTKEALRTAALLDQFCAMAPEDRRAFLELAAMQDRAIRISEGKRPKVEALVPSSGPGELASDARIAAAKGG
jgi:hypothetical protein